MSGPENQDPGTKPTPPPPKKDDTWLPPRLREKLDEVEDEPNPGSPVVGWIVGLLVVVVVVAAGWWFVHSRQVKAEAERAAARAAVVADSIAKVRTADSLVAVARADSIAAFNELPPWKQRQVLARQAGIPIEAGPFTLDAGEYLFEDRAREEATALETATKLKARIARGPAGAYHIYLGRFEDREDARSAATRLAAKALVTQATVVPLR